MGAALVVLMLLQAAGGRAPFSMTDMPGWAKTPTAAEAMAVYPAAAAQANFAGSATVECTVNAEGGLENCVPIAESTPGAGFGAAAVTLASKFLMPTKSPSGAPMAGRTVRFPVRWLNSAKSQAPPVIVQSDTPQSGSVVYNCRVTPDRGYDNCVVVDAKPPGNGLFPQAGVAVMRQRAPQSAAPGGRLMVVIQLKASAN